MQNKVTQNKELCTLVPTNPHSGCAGTVKTPRSINELLRVGGRRLSDLKAKTQSRTLALGHVCAALPPTLAESVVSAGFEDGQLTIGVSGASWATRLRYITDTLRARVSLSMGVDVQRVRIRVVPPRA